MLKPFVKAISFPFLDQRLFNLIDNKPLKSLKESLLTSVRFPIRNLQVKPWNQPLICFSFQSNPLLISRLCLGFWARPRESLPSAWAHPGLRRQTRKSSFTLKFSHIVADTSRWSSAVLESDSESFRAEEDAPGQFHERAFLPHFLRISVASKTLSNRLGYMPNSVSEIFEMIWGDQGSAALDPSPSALTLHLQIRFARSSRKPFQTLDTYSERRPRRFWRIWRVSQLSTQLSSAITSWLSSHSPSPLLPFFFAFSPSHTSSTSPRQRLKRRGRFDRRVKQEKSSKTRNKNHSTQDSRVVPHRGTN